MSRLDEIDRARLGERLRVARNARGVTQEQAAKALGVARTTMLAIERGERPVKPDELIALATLYEVTAGSLLRETAVHVDLVAQFRRAPAGAAAGEDREALEVPPRLASLVAEAYGRGLLSEGQVAETLAVDRVEAREILDAFAAGEGIQPACA